MTKEDYNQRYSKKEFYWGLSPHHLVKESIKYLKSPAKVLDLGCGEGKDSFYLAKNNYDVTSADISETGINKLKDFANKENLKIKTSIANAKEYLDDCENFDAIFCMNVLQFIDEKNILETIEKIKSKTVVGGINVIASFVANSEEQKKKIIQRGGYLFDEGELKELYRDWEILSYEEVMGDWETHGLPRHRHFKVNIIAKKSFP